MAVGDSYNFEPFWMTKAQRLCEKERVSQSHQNVLESRRIMANDYHVGSVSLEHFANGEWNPNKTEAMSLAKEVMLHRNVNTPDVRCSDYHVYIALVNRETC